VSTAAGSLAVGPVVVVVVGVTVGVSGAVRLAASASAYERRPRGLSASGSGCLGAAGRDSRASCRGGRRAQQTGAHGQEQERGGLLLPG
jgi:hypothetical protein